MATQVNVISDLGNISRLPNKILDELVDKTNLCIGSAIHDALAAGEQSTVMNIGIGTLSIDLINMQCKFVPSKDLKSTIKRCIANNVDPLEIRLEQALSEKLVSICEDSLL